MLFTLDMNSSDPESFSRAAGMVPLLASSGYIWFGGHFILMNPDGYRYPKSCLVRLPSVRSPSSRGTLADIALPTSRDGTRFLICDHRGFPLVVDISGVIASDLAV